MKKISPQLTCTIQTYDLSSVRSNLAPDENFENILKQLNDRIIYLPNYPYPLKHGDQITVFGKQATDLKRVINQLNDDGQGIIVNLDYYGIPINLNEGPWTLITGEDAGDGTATEVSPNYWEMVGPNDGNDEGWIYLKKQFPDGATVKFDYSWSTDDEGGGCCDWVIGGVFSFEPNGLPPNYEEIISEFTPEEKSVTFIASPGQWIYFGIYSTDSCCGAGNLNFTITEN